MSGRPTEVWYAEGSAKVFLGLMLDYPPPPALSVVDTPVDKPVSWPFSLPIKVLQIGDRKSVFVLIGNQFDKVCEYDRFVPIFDPCVKYRENWAQRSGWLEREAAALSKLRRPPPGKGAMA